MKKIMLSGSKSHEDKGIMVGGGGGGGTGAVGGLFTSQKWGWEVLSGISAETQVK